MGLVPVSKTWSWPVVRCDQDDRSLRACTQTGGRIVAAEFDELRKRYAIRRDFGGHRIPADSPPALAQTLKTMGFEQSSH